MLVAGLDVSRREDLECGVGCTKQSFSDECDIKKILARYVRTGRMDHARSVMPQFLNCEGIGSYQECLEKINGAKDAFATLPALVRRRFDNDPNLLIQFLSDPSSLDEAIKLGLVDAPKAQVPPPSDSRSEKV